MSCLVRAIGRFMKCLAGPDGLSYRAILQAVFLDYLDGQFCGLSYELFY